MSSFLFKFCRGLTLTPHFTVRSGKVRTIACLGCWTERVKLISPDLQCNYLTNSSELKRRLKAEQKEKEKLEKAKGKEKLEKGTGKNKVENEAEISPNVSGINIFIANFDVQIYVVWVVIMIMV